MIYDATNGEPISVEGSVDQRGIAKMEVTYVAATLDLAWGIAPGEYSGLVRTGLSLRKLGGGGYNVTGTYEGAALGGTGDRSGQNAEDMITYELDFTQAQKPIQVHPNFATKKKGLKEVYKWGALDADNASFGFQEKCPDGVTPVVGEKGEGVNPLFGVTDWLDIGAIWRKSWMEKENTIPESIFTNLGRIDTPDGPVPTVNQGRNWLRSAAKVRGRGRIWECTVEWMLSGRGGHEPAIYKTQK
ncbi:MAG: hypothetical protein D4R65_10080 [Verrucomicrobiaceae bacterium]|nr:MAG: hypothetical protein D4R65_10080 [Verrucomicrobiaceae bacterium]